MLPASCLHASVDALSVSVCVCVCISIEVDIVVTGTLLNRQV